LSRYCGPFVGSSFGPVRRPERGCIGSVSGLGLNVNLACAGRHCSGRYEFASAVKLTHSSDRNSASGYGFPRSTDFRRDARGAASRGPAREFTDGRRHCERAKRPGSFDQ